MSRPTFPQALNALLEPLGFSREKMSWTRRRGDLEDVVDLERYWANGQSTANLSMIDVTSDAILRRIDCKEPLFFQPVSVPIGHLIDRLHHAWSKEPNGPAELVAAVRTYGLPWFDTVHTLEDQAREWIDDIGRKPLFSAQLAAIVVTYARLGRGRDALRYFADPPGKLINPVRLARKKCLQRWLEGQLGMEPGSGGAFGE